MTNSGVWTIHISVIGKGIYVHVPSALRGRGCTVKWVSQGYKQLKLDRDAMS